MMEDIMEVLGNFFVWFFIRKNAAVAQNHRGPDTYSYLKQTATVLHTRREQNGPTIWRSWRVGEAPQLLTQSHLIRGGSGEEGGFEKVREGAGGVEKPGACAVSVAQFCLMTW